MAVTWGAPRAGRASAGFAVTVAGPRMSSHGRPKGARTTWTGQPGPAQCPGDGLPCMRAGSEEAGPRASARTEIPARARVRVDARRRRSPACAARPAELAAGRQVLTADQPPGASGVPPGLPRPRRRPARAAERTQGGRTRGDVRRGGSRGVRWWSANRAAPWSARRASAARSLAAAPARVGAMLAARTGAPPFGRETRQEPWKGNHGKGGSIAEYRAVNCWPAVPQLPMPRISHARLTVASCLNVDGDTVKNVCA